MWPMHLQRLKLLYPTVKEQMYLQENTVFDLWPDLRSRSHKMLPSTSTSLWTKHLQSLKLLRPVAWEEMHLQEHTFYDLDLGVKVTQNVAQYSLHQGTYAATKFEEARSKGYKKHDTRTDGWSDRWQTNFGMKFPFFLKTKGGINTWFDLWPSLWGQGHMKHCQIPFTSYDPSTCKVWSCYVQWFRRSRIFKKNTLFDLWPWPWGQYHVNYCPVASTSYDLSTCKVWSSYVQ